MAFQTGIVDQGYLHPMKISWRILVASAMS